jgi:thiamine-monophosphate kinase
VFGEVPAGAALLRSGARPGDELWVSGQLGDARLALEVFRGTVELDGADFAAVRPALECPQPRVALGLALRGLASSAIDLSDGLLGDLGHVLARSGEARFGAGRRLGARLNLDALPRSLVLARQPAELQQQCLLTGGDDYELLFTAPPEQRAAVQVAAATCALPVSRIGTIEAEAGVQVLDCAGQPVPTPWHAFDHFRA